MAVNNKGQSLVLFVLLLPLLLMIIAVVFEMGRMLLIKNEYKDAASDAISYSLYHLEDADVLSKTQRLLDANIEGNSEVQIENQTVTVHISDKIEGVFSFFAKDIYQIDLTYRGYNDNGKIKITEE